MGMKENLVSGHKHLLAKLLMAANGVLVLLLVFFSLINVFSSDDYWYSTFWDHGLFHYMELMRDHYATFNGRVLVHIAAHIILHFDSWAFALCLIGMSVAISMTVSNTFRLGADRFQLALCCLLIGILAMPLDMFNQGIMWISGWCNYYFPVVLVCLLIAALERRSNWAYLLAFLCGATTEQVGLTSTVLCVVFGAFALLRKKDVLRCVSCTVLCMAGVITIFLSPATRNRAETYMPHNDLNALMDLMLVDLKREAGLWYQNLAPMCVMITVLVLGAMLLRRRYGLRWPGVMAAVSCVTVVVCSCFEAAYMPGFVVGAAALAVLSLVLMHRGCSVAGGLILTSLASAAVMLPTNTIVPRAMVPVYLLLLLSCCNLMTVQIKKTERMGMPLLVALVITLVYIAPTVQGYWHNYQIDLINRNYAAEDADKAYVRYCTDYDERYTMIKADRSEYFKKKYAESIGRHQDIPIRFFGLNEKPPTICYGDQELAHLAVRKEDGKVLLPLRELIEIMGGRIEWSLECYAVEYDSVVYQMDLKTADAVILRWKDGSGMEQEFCGYREMVYGSTYFDVSVFTDLFGIAVKWDPDRGSYIIGR